MKATKQPPWPDWTPGWERYEVADHLSSESRVLTSQFLSEPVDIDQARERRENGEPLEYILKHCHLGSITLKVDKRALIPREETETLVRRFTRRESELPDGPIVDCGTGSGFLASWIACNTERTVFATERHPEPIQLARENKNQLNLNFELIQGDRLSFLRDEIAGIVANLPYVLPGSPRLEEAVQDYEPREALMVPTSPRQFFGEVIQRASEILKPGGELWMELDDSLFEKLKDDFFHDSSYDFVVQEDLSGRNRFFILRC